MTPATRSDESGGPTAPLSATATITGPTVVAVAETPAIGPVTPIAVPATTGARGGTSTLAERLLTGAPSVTALPTTTAATAAATATLTASAPTPAPTISTAPAVSGVHRVGRLAVLALPVGVLVSVLTSHDLTWWHHHFSQLGTHSDFSGRTFNTIVMFSGFFLAAYGVFVSVALPAGIRRRSSRAFRGALTSAGLHLTAVGLVPIPVSPVMHDLIATGLGLSFLATVATGLAIPGRTRRFRRATTLCVALLAIGMIVLTAGFITLALFELVAFVTMGAWLLALPRALAHAPAPTTAPQAPRAEAPGAADRPPCAPAKASTFRPCAVGSMVSWTTTTAHTPRLDQSSATPDASAPAGTADTPTRRPGSAPRRQPASRRGIRASRLLRPPDRPRAASRPLRRPAGRPSPSAPGASRRLAPRRTRRPAPPTRGR